MNLPRDQFGNDHRPVGRSACARRSCTGCCFCDGVPLPLYVEIRILKPPVWSSGMACDRAALDPWSGSCLRWVAVDELEREVRLAGITAERPAPVPVYLLGRACGYTGTRYGHGSVVCLPGAVRNHVYAEHLAEWAERLATVSIRLEILSGEAPECTIGPDVRARIDAHLTRQAQLTEQANAEWELSRQEIVELNSWYSLRSVEAAGCGGMNRRSDHSFARATSSTTRRRLTARRRLVLLWSSQCTVA